MNIKLVGRYGVRNVNICSAYFRLKCLELLKIKEEMIYFQSFWKQRNNFFRTQDCISGKSHSFSFIKNGCSKKRKQLHITLYHMFTQCKHQSSYSVGQLFTFRLIDKQLQNWFSVGKFGLPYHITTILYIKKTIHHTL